MQYQDREHLTTDYEILYDLYNSDRFYSYSEERQKLIRVYLKAQKKYEKYEKAIENIEYKIEQFENDGSSSYYSNIIEYEKQLQNYKKLYSLYHNCVLLLYKNSLFTYVINKERKLHLEKWRQNLHLQHINSEYYKKIQVAKNIINRKYYNTRKNFDSNKRIELAFIYCSLAEVLFFILLSVSLYFKLYGLMLFSGTVFGILCFIYLFLYKYKEKKNIHYNQFDFSIKKSLISFFHKEAFNKALKITGVVFVVLIFIAFIILGIRAPIKKALAPDSIELITMTNYDVSPGNNVYIEIKGDSDTEYNINVKYKSGKSKAQGLENKTTDYSGNVWWEWKVGTNTTPGKYPITITNTKSFYSETFYFTVE